MDCLTTPEIEVAVARWIGPRQHLIVPNVSWGLGLHECDLLSLSKSGYASEIEIKVSRSDLVRDGEKLHQHRSERIRYLWYAMPLRMESCCFRVPERAGIILVNRNGNCVVKRNASVNTGARKFTDAERMDLARLGALRIWSLKKKLIHAQDQSESDYSI